MISKLPLTAEQRHTSQINYYRFNAINGFSYMCLGETVVVLFANKLNAPNTVLAAVGAMLYMGFLLLPLGVLRAGKVGAARCQADFWVVRNIAALLVACSTFLVPFGYPVAWANLLLWCFVFYGSRAAGIVLSQPLVGDITTTDDRAKVLGDSSSRFYLAAVVALVGVSVLLHVSDSLTSIMIIMGIGSVCGIFASTFIRKIDETETIMLSARKKILPQLPKFFHDLSLRRQVYAGICCNIANIMLASISIATLKRGYGVSDTNTIIFATTEFAACFLGCRLTAPLANRFGPRNLVLLSYLLVFPVCILWVIFPDKLPDLFICQTIFALPFILLGLFISLYNNALQHYFLEAVPKEDQVVETICINIITGVGGSLFAMFAASSLLQLAERYAAPGLPVFKTYFTAACILLLIGIPFFLKLPRLNNSRAHRN